MSGKNHNKYQKNWYQRNKDKHYKNVSKRRKLLKQKMREYKSSLSCDICGYSFKGHPSVCDFHHINGNKKDIAPSQIINQGYSFEWFMEEVSKCIPLCANCHRIMHTDKD